MRREHAEHVRAARKRAAPTTQRARGLCPRAFSAKRRTYHRSKRSLERLVDAAVAARGAGPPGVIRYAGHRALKLVDVAHKIFLAALEGLLELLELGAPALHLVLAQLHVGFELGLTQLELALAFRQLENAGVDDCLRDRGRGSGRQRRAAEQRGERVRLLRGDLHAKDERLR